MDNVQLTPWTLRLHDQDQALLRHPSPLYVYIGFRILRILAGFARCTPLELIVQIYQPVAVTAAIVDWLIGIVVVIAVLGLAIAFVFAI